MEKSRAAPKSFRCRPFGVLYKALRGNKGELGCLELLAIAVTLVKTVLITRYNGMIDGTGWGVWWPVSSTMQRLHSAERIDHRVDSKTTILARPVVVEFMFNRYICMYVCMYV